MSNNKKNICPVCNIAAPRKIEFCRGRIFPNDFSDLTWRETVRIVEGRRRALYVFEIPLDNNGNSNREILAAIETLLQNKTS